MLSSQRCVSVLTVDGPCLPGDSNTLGEMQLPPQQEFGNHLQGKAGRRKKLWWPPDWATCERAWVVPGFRTGTGPTIEQKIASPGIGWHWFIVKFIHDSWFDMVWHGLTTGWIWLYHSHARRCGELGEMKKQLEKACSGCGGAKWI